jgi:hypothetical protein
MVSVPTRAALELEATEYVTLPAPVPDVPLVMVIQLALLAAVQEAVAGLTDTATLAEPPVAGILADAMFKENTAAAAAWVIVSARPPTVMDPTRCEAALFAATE